DDLRLERACLHPVAGGDLVDLHLAQAVLVELPPQEPAREAGGVDRHGPDRLDEVRQRPDVVLVAVGEDDRVHVLPALGHVAEVRQDQVDAELLRRRELDAAVDDHEPAVQLVDVHVLAAPPRSAERDDPEALAVPHYAAWAGTPCCSSTARRISRSTGVACTSGSRSSGVGMSPIMWSAALTRIGFAVTNRASYSGRSAASRRSASTASPARAAATTSAIRSPTRCEATEMTPAPPIWATGSSMSSLPA